jgi:hypothetical protein
MMLVDFRVRTDGRFCQLLGPLMLGALAFIAGCASVKPVTVTIGPAAKLPFTAQPVNVAAGNSIVVTVSIEEIFNFGRIRGCG